ncbi:hypothetical protein BJX62DRAFT_171747 [Aspergillus germanicus]
MIPFRASICSSQRTALRLMLLSSSCLMFSSRLPFLFFSFLCSSLSELDGCTRKKRMIRLSAGTWLGKCDLGCLAGRSALAIVVNPTCELCRFVDKLSYMLFDLCSPYLYDLFQFMCNIPCVFFFSLPLRTALPCVCSGWQSCRCYEYVQSNSSLTSPSYFWSTT